MINSKYQEELVEITRIAPKIVAIIDSERDSPGGVISQDRQAFTRICSDLEIACHVLDRRATENYPDLNLR